MFQWGVFFSDGASFIFKWGGGHPVGGISFGGDRGFLKKIVRWGRAPHHVPHYGKS